MPRAQRMYTYDEAAQVLRVSKASAIRHIAKLHIPLYRKPQDNRRFITQTALNQLWTAYWLAAGYRRPSKTNGQRESDKVARERSGGNGEICAPQLGEPIAPGPAAGVGGEAGSGIG